MTLFRKTVVVCGITMLSLPAFAYIGPGSGISLLSGLWGILVAIVLAVGAILIWPIRYAFRRVKRKLRGDDPKVASGASTATESDSSGSSSASSD